MMPRIAPALLALGASACGFDADYANGHFHCSDGKCPADLACVANACVPASSTGDGPRTDDATSGSGSGSDAPAPALTCIEPGTGTHVTGTTASPAANHVTAMCAGTVMNGNDAVYKVHAAIGQTITLHITGALAAYAIAPCLAAPQTPACEGNAYATAGNPAAIAATITGDHFIVVDAVSPATSGAYTLDIAVN